MKIGVVGGGNGGLVVALYLLRETFNKDVEIEIYYDPNIPIEKVGQGSLVNFVGLLSDFIDINWYNNPINATFKTGILYEGWGKKKDKFFHHFPLDFMAVHYSPNKLREYMIEKKVCKFIEQNVEDCNDLDCDYVFDCRGTPKDFSYYNILKNPLNHVVLKQTDGVDHDQYWTRCIATPDGWMFSIPGKDHTSFGYLYNTDFTSHEQARSNFGCNENAEHFGFQNYLARKPIYNDKVILNGNRLTFIEPLEASSVETYYQWTSMVCQWIFGERSKRSILEELVESVVEVQNFILWHYATGSKYDTKFWAEAEKMARDHSYEERFFDFIRDAKSNSRIELNLSDDYDQYGHWHTTSFHNWIDGTQNSCYNK
jgi:hypothetical protein